MISWYYAFNLTYRRNTPTKQIYSAARLDSHREQT